MFLFCLHILTGSKAVYELIDVGSRVDVLRMLVRGSFHRDSLFSEKQNMRLPTEDDCRGGHGVLGVRECENTTWQTGNLNNRIWVISGQSPGPTCSWRS